MAKSEHSSYQQGVIKRYYDNLPAQTLTKLGELVTELYLAETQKKRDQLWLRVEKAMAKIKIPKTIAQHILSKRKPEIFGMDVMPYMNPQTGAAGIVLAKRF